MDANTFHPLMHDRGRGPELVGTRITVYNVWDELFHPDTTDAELCRRYDITPEGVAVLRAFAFQHYAEVAAVIRRMDERTERRIAEQAIILSGKLRGSRERFELRKQWYAQRRENPDLFPEVPGESAEDHRERVNQEFEAWLADRHPQPVAGV